MSNTRRALIMCHAGVRPRCLAAAAPNTRRLILMRHAESVNMDGLRNHDQPISVEGENDCRKVAKKMEETGWVPDIVLSSNAVRSKSTYDVMKSVVERLNDADLHFLGSLYTLSQLDGHTLPHLGKLIAQEASPEQHCVLCLGHNKGWEEAASVLAGKQVFLDHCDAALLETEGSAWSYELFEEGNTWRLVDVLRST